MGLVTASVAEAAVGLSLLPAAGAIAWAVLAGYAAFADGPVPRSVRALLVAGLLVLCVLAAGEVPEAEAEHTYTLRQVPGPVAESGPPSVLAETAADLIWATPMLLSYGCLTAAAICAARDPAARTAAPSHGGVPGRSVTRSADHGSALVVFGLALLAMVAAETLHGLLSAAPLPARVDPDAETAVAVMVAGSGHDQGWSRTSTGVLVAQFAGAVSVTLGCLHLAKWRNRAQP